MNGRISIRPRICHGQACIPAHQIVRMFAHGDNLETLLGAYPSITREDILACLDYAASLAEDQGTERQGMFDDELWPLAQAEQRTLVTTDKGFSAHRDEQHFGLLVVRQRQPNEHRIHARIMAAFRQLPEREWPGLFVVMRDTVQSVHRK